MLVYVVAMKRTPAANAQCDFGRSGALGIRACLGRGSQESLAPNRDLREQPPILITGLMPAFDDVSFDMLQRLATGSVVVSLDDVCDGRRFPRCPSHGALQRDG